MRRSTVLGGGKGAHSIADATVCPGCSHPVRLHNAIGCVRGECSCSLSPDDITAPAAVLPVPLQPPSARSVDLLDPMCRCGHRRGKHAQAGTAIQCQRCTCRGFSVPEIADVPATTAGPAPATAAAPAGPAARDETRPDTGATARAGFGLGLKAPRRADPHPAAQAAPAVAAVVGGDSDADEAAVVTVAAVAPVDLTELAAVATPRAAAALATAATPTAEVCQQLAALRSRSGMSQTELAHRSGVAQSHISAMETASRPVTVDVVARVAQVLGRDVEIRLVDPSAESVDVEDLVRRRAIDMYRAWLCPKCHARRHDRVRCCRRPLQPVWVAVLPREVNE